MNDSNDFTKEQEDDYSDFDLLYQDQNEPLFDSSSYSFLSDCIETIDGSPPTPQPPPSHLLSQDNYQKAPLISKSDKNQLNNSNPQNNLNITNPLKNKHDISNNVEPFSPSPLSTASKIKNSQPKNSIISCTLNAPNHSRNIQYENPQLQTFIINPNQICYQQFLPQHLMNLRPCIARYESHMNCTNVKGVSSGCCIRTRMGRIQLPQNVQKFKNRYYSILTTRKIFRKQIVIDIHNKFLVNKLGYKPVSRDEYRDIRIYFINYYSKKDEILNALEQNKTQIKNNFPIP